MCIAINDISVVSTCADNEHLATAAYLLVRCLLCLANPLKKSTLTHTSGQKFRRRQSYEALSLLIIASYASNVAGRLKLSKIRTSLGDLQLSIVDLIASGQC